MLVMLAEGPQSASRVNVLGRCYLTGRFSGVDDWPVLGVDRGLEGREWLALFLDGVVIGGQTVIVGLGLTRDGEKVTVGLRLGSTENAVVCTDLLQDLLARGLTLPARVLGVIDGGKVLTITKKRGICDRPTQTAQIGCGST